MPNHSPVTKRCAHCRQHQPLSKFGADRSRRDGRHNYCGPCRAELRRSERPPTPEQRRAQELWKRYRLTVRQFDHLLASQGGRCLLCRTANPGGRWGRFVVDHDHRCCPGRRSCGECVRSLLCNACNVFVGRVESDYGHRVIEYVQHKRVGALRRADEGTA